MGNCFALLKVPSSRFVVTCDKNIGYQQNLKEREIALIVLSTNDWSILQNAGPIIATAIDHAQPFSFQIVNVNPTAC